MSRWILVILSDFLLTALLLAACGGTAPASPTATLAPGLPTTTPPPTATTIAPPTAATADRRLRGRDAPGWTERSVLRFRGLHGLPHSHDG